MPRNGMGAGGFNARPGYQGGDIRSNNPVSSGVPGSFSQFPNIGPPSPSRISQSDSLRMYEFKKHEIIGRKPDWQIADRRMIPRTDSELKARIIKPAKDNKGNSSKRDFNSGAMAGYKQEQSQQLLEDLQRHDQGFEWQLELIELHDLRKSSETGKGVCSKMIVIVSRNPRKRFMLAPGRMWPLGDAVVDLGPPLRPAPPVYHSAGGQQGWPPADQSNHGGWSAPNVGQQPRPNADGNHHPRPTPLYNIQEGHGRQGGSQGVLQPGQGERGKNKNEGRVTPIYNHQEKHGHPQPHAVPERGHAEKGKRKKDEKKQKPVTIIEIPSPKAYDDDDDDDDDEGGDSDSSSNRDSAFDGHTFRSSDTEISLDSPRSDKKYFSQKEFKSKKHSGNVPEASREHRRKNPTEYMQEARGRQAKSEVIIEPASSRRHRGSSYARSPSFTRGRPAPGRADPFDDDYFRRYDDSPPPRRRVSIHDRRIAPRMDLREEADLERERMLQLELENIRLERELKDRDLREDILREEIMRDELLRKERLREERLREERLREERLREERLREDRLREERLRDRQWARYDDKPRSSRYKPAYL